MAENPAPEDEMERESSTKSTEASDSEESSASDGEDSDYSSDFDLDECDARREECVEVMNDIEKQFNGLKEQLYRERLEQIELKLGQVRCGRSAEYLGPLQKLQENMQIRTHVAGVLRELRIKALKNRTEADLLAAQQNFESEKALLFDALKEDLEEKIHRLEEDRHNLDLTTDLWQESKRNSRKQRADGLGGAGGGGASGEGKRKKPVSVTGPYLVYLLGDSEIIEDWTIIKKSVIVQQNVNRNSSVHKRSKSSEIHSVY